MTNLRTARTAVLATAGLAVFAAGLLIGASNVGTPKSVLHIITVEWKPDATADQKAAALDGVKQMAGAVGIKNVWLKTLKVQPEGYSNVIVMEFQDEAAFQKYTADPAHKAWEKVYLPFRAESRTHDVTN